MMRRLFFELRYALKHTPWDTGITPPELYAFLGRSQPGRALDLGCGTGTNAITLAEHGWQVTGVDLSARAIRLARRKTLQTAENVQFLHEDILRLRGVDGPFDLVLDIGCFHSLSQLGRETYCRNLVRLTEPGAVFLLYTWLGDTAEQKGLLSENAIQQLFTPEFDTDLIERGTDRAHPSAWFTFSRGHN